MTEEMRQAMRFFKTTIKYDYATTTAAEAYKEPVCISAGRSEIAKNYKDLAKEILQRIKEVEQHGLIRKAKPAQKFDNGHGCTKV